MATSEENVRRALNEAKIEAERRLRQDEADRKERVRRDLERKIEEDRKRNKGK